MRTEDMTVGQIQAGETNSGGFPFKTVKFSATVDLASVAANVSAEQNVTIADIKSGDIPVHLNAAAGTATLMVYPQRCGADNTLTVRCLNPTASPIDHTGATMVVTCLRPVTRL